MKDYFTSNTLTHLAEETISEFDASKLVIFHIPYVDNSEDWAYLICDNINNRFISEFDFIDDYRFNAVQKPQDFIAEVFNQNINKIKWSEVLKDSAHNKPIYIIFDSNNLSQDWSDIFKELVSAYQSWNRDFFCKKIVVIFLGLEEKPSWTKSPAVRYFQLWNVISWEEMRNLARSWLPDNKNPFFLEWQIASYVGAAQSNPFLLKKLCMEMPTNYKAIVELLSNISGGKSSEDKLLPF